MLTRRLLVVTSVVGLLGGAAGAVGGALVLAAMSLVAGSPLHGLLQPAFFGVAGLIGFVHGAVL
ncbi:MAG: hypothetical protein WC700_19410, partial [Gemmatimonadaceae bacterium]